MGWWCIREQWKPIKDFEYYYISNLGNVKSTRRWSGTKFYNREHLISLYVNKKNGYVYANICKNNKSYNFRVHKLVAENFIDNPNNYTQINHIDGNKKNNKVDNLEWCTGSYNIKDMYKRNGKYDKDNEIIQKYQELKSCKKTAKLFDVSSETIRCILKRNNIKRTNKGGRPIRLGGDVDDE